MRALSESSENPALTMSDAEREQVLCRFNDTARPYPKDGLIHLVFSDQALRTPDAVAIEHADRRMSYAELERSANRVARALIARGVRPDDTVGLYAERSAELIIGMLGILKSGGAYVPLDPNYPAERLTFMIADSSPVALLTTPELLPRASRLGVPTISLSDEMPYADCAPSVRELTSRNLAYVTYTSGSTGVPKGALIEHRSVLRLAINPLYARVGPGDRVPHCASPTFDAATWEIWAPLLNGATVLVIPQCVLMDPISFNRALVELGATAMWLTVGLFHEYVDALELALSGLRLLITGGDVVSPVIAARALSKPKRPAQLINAYGPTESTTFATMLVMEAPGGQDVGALPIGRPIANTRVYVLDANREPVPIGATGEIYIGGPGVARGYLNQPDITAERFVPDCFGSDKDAKLYRTGDLGRWRADGNIEFLGRNDSQVKIRGFRVELGEVETRLRSAPGVLQAVVVQREDPPHEKRLVAYLVAATSALASPAAVRAHVAAVLPEYMVPCAYVFLEKLPLTSNGKVDRTALPPPTELAIVSHAYESPNDGIEERLARIWSDTLGISRVGRHDDFFELGGDSMQGMRLATRVSDVFQTEFPIAAVFQYPILLEMAGHVLALIREQASLEAGEEVVVVDGE